MHVCNVKPTKFSAYPSVTVKLLPCSLQIALMLCLLSQQILLPTSLPVSLVLLPTKPASQPPSDYVAGSATAQRQVKSSCDADLEDKENDSSSLRLMGSDTQSASQDLKEEEQGKAAAAAAAQVKLSIAQPSVF